ncbi:MAG: hypothetical protein JO102_01090 [Elusimicrobia bacterium]|nr:hypothetical protein [Elusimicrobiota bacterium]
MRFASTVASEPVVGNFQAVIRGVQERLAALLIALQDLRRHAPPRHERGGQRDHRMLVGALLQGEESFLRGIEPHVEEIVQARAQLRVDGARNIVRIIVAARGGAGEEKSGAEKDGKSSRTHGPPVIGLGGTVTEPLHSVHARNQSRNSRSL